MYNKIKHSNLYIVQSDMSDYTVAMNKPEYIRKSESLLQVSKQLGITSSTLV